MRPLMFSILFLALVPGVGRAVDLLASKEQFFTSRLGEQVPLDLTFKDEAGKTVKLGDFGHNKPIVLVLAYFQCPRLCTLVLNDLVKGLRGVPFNAGREYEVLVVSFDPREGPELAVAKKKAYVEAYGRPGAEAGWHFLTGNQPEIDQLLAAVGFRAVWDEEGKQFAHARALTFLTPVRPATGEGGKIARNLLGGDYHPTTLRLSLVEASEGHISSPVDRVLLMCFAYNPSTAKYSTTVLGIVRLAGAGTILVLLATWAVWWRRGRRSGNLVAAG